MKITEKEAIQCKQELLWGPCYSFEAALKEAGLEFKKENLLDTGEDYNGFIAVYCGRSEIKVYHLLGSLEEFQHGSVEFYASIGIKGNCRRFFDLARSATGAVKSGFFSKELSAKLVEAFREEEIFEVDETEKDAICNYFGENKFIFE